MCHHVDMAIDWEEVVDSEQKTQELDTTDEVGEPTLDEEALTPEVTSPADD